MRVNRIMAIAAFLIAAGGTAVADGYDRGSIKDAPYVAPYSWTGFYGGLNAGGSWSKGNTDYSQSPSGGFGGDFGDPFDVTGLTRGYDTNDRAFIGGGQIGYNIQTNGVVFGIETDIKWRRLNGDASQTFVTFNDQLALQSEQSWVGSLRGRLGWAQDEWLLFITGGLAYGRVEHSILQTALGFGGRTISESDVKTGWTIGAGLDYALTPSWSFGMQYLYTDLGSTTLIFPRQTINFIEFATSSVDFDDRSHEVTARLNYKIGN